MLPTGGTATQAVESLAHAAKDDIPGVLGVGITVTNQDGSQSSTGATDSIVRKLDDLQYSIGEGPCLTAVTTARTIRIDDITTEDRWPRWTEAASHFPVRSTLSVPLIHAGRTIGAMKAYSPDLRGLTQETESSLRRFVVPAAALLATAQIPEAPARLSADLRDALGRRDSIGMAKGILMERHGIGPEDALAKMLNTCREQRITLHQTAEDTITGTGNTGTEGIRGHHEF
ncbi:ANTAR domain-containing protein [Arthrobacter sp. AET 35A]|nr:ANTAR domain-containing protein [Arthrobacter sp. AET 35A]